MSHDDVLYFYVWLLLWVFPVWKVRRVFAFWNEYVAWAQDQFPEVLPTLNGAASDEQLDELEAALHKQLPETLRLLYRFHAGQVRCMFVARMVMVIRSSFLRLSSPLPFIRQCLTVLQISLAELAQARQLGPCLVGCVLFSKH